jgi:hypothetical protein
MDIGDMPLWAHDDYLNVANMQPPGGGQIRVPDVDATFKRAIEKGVQAAAGSQTCSELCVAHLRSWGNRWAVDPAHPQPVMWTWAGMQRSWRRCPCCM